MKTELSDGEWTLMSVLWESAPMTIMQLTRALEPETGWGKNTIITMLNRLEAKGVVSAVSNGRAKEYTPLLLHRDAARRETSHFLDKVFNGRMGVMLNAMIDSDALTRDEIDELSAILERAKEEKRHG